MVEALERLQALEKETDQPKVDGASPDIYVNYQEAGHAIKIFYHASICKCKCCSARMGTGIGEGGYAMANEHACLSTILA